MQAYLQMMGNENGGNTHCICMPYVQQDIIILSASHFRIWEALLQYALAVFDKNWAFYERLLYLHTMFVVELMIIFGVAI